jgi:hypothetical protein
MPSSSIQIPVSFSVATSPGVWRRRTWSNTANYRNVPRDNRPVNPYSDERRYIQQDRHGGAWKTLLSDGTRTYVQLPNNYTLLLIDIEGLYNTALSASGFVSAVSGYEQQLVLECLKELSDSKINLGVAAAEASKTINHITHTATRIYDAMRAFKRGNLRQVAIHLGLTPGTAHKSWLEYKYGWMPLLMDVKGAAEHFAQHQVGRPLRITSSKKKTVPFSWTRRVDYGLIYGSSTQHGFYTETIKGTYDVRVKLVADVTNPQLSTLQQLGLTNPALIAWELVPFSFVFDWFVSVGDYLTGLTALNGLTLKRTMRSNTNVLTYEGKSPTTIASDASYQYINSAKYWRLDNRNYARSSFVVNPLSLFPPLKLDRFGFQKFTTSLALLRGNARGFSKASVFNPRL